jgi:hypothetical protein
MDVYFGTFKASFSEHPVDKNGPKPREDAKSSLRVIPTREFVIYLVSSLGCVFTWLIPALQFYTVTQTQALQLASIVGFGPVVLATIISYMSGASGVHPVQMNILANLMHLGVGSVFCSLPVTYLCYLTLVPQN